MEDHTSKKGCLQMLRMSKQAESLPFHLWFLFLEWIWLLLLLGSILYAKTQNLVSLAAEIPQIPQFRVCYYMVTYQMCC